MGTEQVNLNGVTITPAQSQTALMTEGQRNINRIWEYTQAIIAIIVVLANVIVWVFVVLSKLADPIPTGLSNALFLIVGFYFSRTNHQAIGGVGEKPTQRFEGR